jgi:hypothetical protein
VWREEWQRGADVEKTINRVEYGAGLAQVHKRIYYIEEVKSPNILVHVSASIE